jgi:hypothetical protein
LSIHQRRPHLVSGFLTTASKVKNAEEANLNDGVSSELECDANTNSATPNDPTLFSDGAVEKFKTIR